MISIQLSSNIDITVVCCCNDSEMHASQVRRVDQKTRIASFNDQVITIRLDRIKQGGSYHSLTRSNQSSCDMSMASTASKDSVTLNLKLFAVSDTRQKLIGLVNIPIDWKTLGSEVIMNNEVVPFSKCIDTKAYIQVSVSLKDITLDKPKSIRTGLHQRHIPKPKTLTEMGK